MLDWRDQRVFSTIQAPFWRSAANHWDLCTAGASFNKEVQNLLQAVQSPQEIVDRAAQQGYGINGEQRRLFARRLQEPPRGLESTGRALGEGRHLGPRRGGGACMELALIKAWAVSCKTPLNPPCCRAGRRGKPTG